MLGLDRTPLVCLKPKIASDRLRSLIMGMFLLIYIQYKLRKNMKAEPKPSEEIKQWIDMGFNKTSIDGLLSNTDESIMIQANTFEGLTRPLDVNFDLSYSSSCDSGEDTI